MEAWSSIRFGYLIPLMCCSFTSSENADVRRKRSMCLLVES